MTEPMNVTVCLSQSTTANFTCVVNGGSRNITIAGWQILDVDIYILVTGRARHMLDPRATSTNTDTILTETLTVTDVSLSDNGAKYRCRPVDDVISDVVTLTVIGMYADICNLKFYIYAFACVCSLSMFNILHKIPYTVCMLAMHICLSITFTYTLIKVNSLTYVIYNLHKHTYIMM